MFHTVFYAHHRPPTSQHHLTSKRPQHPTHKLLFVDGNKNEISIPIRILLILIILMHCLTTGEGEKRLAWLKYECGKVRWFSLFPLVALPASVSLFVKKKKTLCSTCTSRCNFNTQRFILNHMCSRQRSIIGEAEGNNAALFLGCTGWASPSFFAAWGKGQAGAASKFFFFRLQKFFNRNRQD